VKGKTIFLLFGLSMLIALGWEKVTIIKNTAHFLLDPTLGTLISWHNLFGLLIIVLLLNILITLIHKFTTDQTALKEIREKTKAVQVQIKEAQKNQDQDKVAELSKQSFSHMGEQMKHSFASMGYTMIPLILLFRWFGDFFTALDNPKIFIGFGWFGTYLIFSIIFSMVIRKVLKVQ
jgi:uncharacterized membrane protein (DUF106 family)